MIEPQLDQLGYPSDVKLDICSFTMTCNSEMKCAILESDKTILKFMPKDQIAYNGTTVVCLGVLNHSLHSLVIEKNTVAPQPISKCFSITCSIGLNKLKKMRNAAQSESMSDESCSLSAYEGLDMKRRRKHTPRSDIQEMRRKHASMEIFAGYGGKRIIVLVLRPVHPNDVLAVAYTANALTAVRHCIRSSGSDEPSQIQDVTLPKGIHKRRNVYFATYMNSEGRTASKSCKTIDEAMATQADMQAQVADMECHNEEVCETEIATQADMRPLDLTTVE